MQRIVTVEISHTDGLHMRPAALIAEFVQSLDCGIECRLPDQEWTRADSVLTIVSLGLTAGDMLELRPVGQISDADLNRLVSLF